MTDDIDLDGLPGWCRGTSYGELGRQRGTTIDRLARALAVALEALTRIKGASAYLCGCDEWADDALREIQEMGE